MFVVAFLIGTFATALLLIGRFGTLNSLSISTLTIFFFTVSLYYLAKFYPTLNLKKFFTTSSFQYKLFIVLIIVAGALNFFGALSPEIFFDALWYHLTLPKIYLAEKHIFFIPGKLFYYSGMPQLIEMLYLPALHFANEIAAKLIHGSFALLTAVAIYQIGKETLSKIVGLVAALIFLTDLSVAWLSSTAYIDLGRTFFETIAFMYFLKWTKTPTYKNLIKTGIMAGFAIGTKYLAIGTAGILGFLIVLFSTTQRLKAIFIYGTATLITSAYWFVNAYLHTGNPIYPIFTKNLDQSHALVTYHPLNFILEFFKLSNQPHDWLTPISPLYLLLFPLALYYGYQKPVLKKLALYCFFGYLIWFFTPRTGGSRFIIPYLPMFALLSASLFHTLPKSQSSLKNLISAAIVLVCCGNLLFRAYINYKKVIPYVLDTQTRHEFLSQNLNFGHVFYDLDHYFQKNLKPEDKVLIIGGHSLYYTEFPFVHETFPHPKNYNYILTQYRNLPEQYGKLTPVYENPTTQVKLYKL